MIFRLQEKTYCSGSHSPRGLKLELESTMKKQIKTVAEIEAELDVKVVAAQAKVNKARTSKKEAKIEELPAPPAEVIIEVEEEKPEVALADIIERVSVAFVGGTPAELPTVANPDPMVFCGLCGRSVPVKTTFMLPSADGDKHYCKKDPSCRKPSGKKVDLKTQAQVASAKVSAAKEKTPKVAKGSNPNIGKFDNCLLSAKENKRANSESIRSAVYNHIASYQGCTIKEMVEDGVALLPVVRDCVKKLFADLKIEISGWEVVTPRTLNFKEIK